MKRVHAPHSKLKAFFVQNEIKQGEVAQVLGMSPSMLNHKLNGRQHFKWSEVQQICDKYNIKPDVFLTAT